MRLIYERGREQIAFPLEEGETYIGRKDYCEIFFPDGSLSKRHCRLVRKGDALYLFDAGSRNGTLLNGEVVDEARLENGDVIQCGKLAFRVEGIPDAGDSYAEFELIEGEDSMVDAGRSRRSQASRSRGSLVTARAVASAEARPSMLDVLPELPPSIEGKGYDEDEEDGSTACEAVFRLVEGGPEQVWELTGEVMTIGSKNENAISLTGEGVSRYHAEVCKEGGVWVVKDLGARNGIFVAGERVDIYELKEGDEVQIGTCKLRFELRKPNPLDAINEVVQAVIKDPVGAFKTDPRVRMAAAAVVASFFLVILALPGGRFTGALSGGRHGEVSQAWLEEGSQLIVAGKFKQARDVFRKARAHVKSSRQRVPRTLSKVCGLWMNVHRGAESFRWDKAADLIQETARLSGLPKPLTAWLKRQDVEVNLNLKAQRELDKAQAMGSRAADQVAAKKFDTAIDTYNKAIAKATGVDPGSKFVARAQQVAKNLQAAGYRAIVSEARSKMKAQNPNWNTCIGLLKKATEFVGSKAQRLEVRSLADTCEQNRRDEAAYMQGVTIVQQRDVERYPVAVRLFESVNRHSRVYPDAQAYIEWIDADLAVRAAKRAYDLGNSGDAFRLLAEALQHDVLGPDARASVQARRTRWGRVVRAYNKGYKAYQAGRNRQAKEEFERVIASEPNRNNRFHARAREWLKHIKVIASFTYNKLLSEGHAALQAGRWNDALRYFADVSRNPNHRRRDLDGIRRAVKKIAEERRLLSHGERDFLYDRTDKFIEMRDIFKLLVLWLPRGHKDRKEARKLLNKVVLRLKNWKKSLRSGYYTGH